MQRYHVPKSARTLTLLVAAAALWWRPFRIAVDGQSMAPALHQGDYLVATARGRPRSGAIVVVERPDRPGLEIVKRVRAVPGEIAGGRLVEAGELWLTGDDPARSTDSRTFGVVARSAVRGVVRFRYWPPARFGPIAPPPA